MPTADYVYRVLMCLGERELLQRFAGIVWGRPKAWSRYGQVSPRRAGGLRGRLRPHRAAVRHSERWHRDHRRCQPADRDLLLIPMSGSADAARSRATDPAATKAEPAAILGLRRCTARAARTTMKATFGASLAITNPVTRRGWRSRHGTPRTIHATGATRPNQRKNRDTRRAAGVSVPAVAGAPAASLRTKSLRCCSSVPTRAARFSSASARVGASVPRPHATSPKPAAPAHSARARCRRPAAQCPAPATAWVTTGATRGTHPRVPEGLPPSRMGTKARHSRALASSRAIPPLSPWRRVRANLPAGARPEGMPG
jgi:hypothetical protein